MSPACKVFIFSIFICEPTKPSLCTSVVTGGVFYESEAHAQIPVSHLMSHVTCNRSPAPSVRLHLIPPAARSRWAGTAGDRRAREPPHSSALGVLIKCLRNDTQPCGSRPPAQHTGARPSLACGPRLERGLKPKPTAAHSSPGPHARASDPPSP